MSHSISGVSLCNDALIKLGDDPILSLTDNNNRARVMNRIYERCRRAVLRDHPWHDSLKRQSLAQMVDAPVFGYDYQYTLPPDLIRIVETDLLTAQSYKIEARVLLTNEKTINILYVYDNEDVTSYDSMHLDALVARLAYEAANAITGKQSLAAGMLQEYGLKLRDAKAVNGQDENDETYTMDTLINVRF